MNTVIDPIASLLGTWSSGLGAGAVTLRIVLSLLLSTIIGCERASKRHAAGLRTFMLVSLASTVAMLLDVYINAATDSDLFLLSAASVVALSIISINSILFSSGNRIKGLTTSVGLWTCGVIGLSIGIGFYTVTLVAFLAALCSLSWFPQLEIYMKNRSNHFEIRLELTNSRYLQDFTSVLRKLGLSIDDIELNPAYVNSGLSVYAIAVSITSPELKKYKTHAEIIEALRTLEYVHYINEMHL